MTGPLPKQLVGGNYFAEQRQFNLSLQANGINFDQFLKVRGQTVEEFRSRLHTQAERKLRSWLGLLLVAEAEGLQPTETEVTTALTDWNEKLDGERTFPANDARKGAPAPDACKGDGLCAGAFHPDAAAPGAGGAGTASEIRKKPCSHTDRSAGSTAFKGWGLGLGSGFFQMQHTGLHQTLAQQGTHHAGHHDLGQIQHDEGIHAHSQCIAQVALHLEHEPGRAQDVAGGIAQHQTHGGDHRLAIAFSMNRPPMKASSR